MKNLIRILGILIVIVGLLYFYGVRIGSVAIATTTINGVLSLDGSQTLLATTGSQMLVDTTWDAPIDRVVVVMGGERYLLYKKDLRIVPALTCCGEPGNVSQWSPIQPDPLRGL